jgi:hypothetical protein
VGFAHGFLTLSATAEVLYKASGFWSQTCERSLRWNDPEVGITWPLDRLSGVAPLLAESTPLHPPWPRPLLLRRCLRERDGSGAWNGQVWADLAHQQLCDVVVPGYGTAPVELGLMPPGVVAAFSQQDAAVLAEMVQSIAALHRARASSS